MEQQQWTACNNVVVRNWPTYRTFLATLSWLLYMATWHTTATPVFQFDADYVRNFSAGHYYYRTFLLDIDAGVLYVGAMNYIYRLNLEDITNKGGKYSMSDPMLTFESTDQEFCRQGNHEQYQCMNHIAVIQKTGSGQLYVCGTNSFNPMDYLFEPDLRRYSPFAPLGSGVGKCPYNPNDQSTAIWIEKGNPDNMPTIYAGTNAHYSNDPIIYRPSLQRNGREVYSFLRTPQADSKWLNDPKFVASFDMGEYVYFFFRETAVEYINCGKTVYSRIVRVCKKDVGGRNVLTENWTTYLKARLNCSIQGEFPFYFNEIRDVYTLPDNDEVFYAVFTTSLNGLTGSAVCVFTNEQIEAAFRGKFKEQASYTSAWLPVRNQDVPEPRPGKCVADSRKLRDDVLNFMKDHPLMDSAVPSLHGQPVFYKRDVIFTTLVVDQIAGLDEEYLVYFLGTNSGEVHKVVTWEDRKMSTPHFNHIATYRVTDEEIRFLTLNPNQYLYAGADSGVYQMSVSQCDRYKLCDNCVHDPYCVYSKSDSICHSLPNLITKDTASLLQSVRDAKGDVCRVEMGDTTEMENVPGQTVFLPCKIPDYLQPLDPERYKITWLHKDKPIVYDDRQILTSDYGLVLININSVQAGQYKCVLQTQTLSRYDIMINSVVCEAPNSQQKYQEKYVEWCREFERYKREMLTWQKLKQTCKT